MTYRVGRCTRQGSDHCGASSVVSQAVRTKGVSFVSGMQSGIISSVCYLCPGFSALGTWLLLEIWIGPYFLARFMDFSDISIAVVYENYL